MTRSIIPTIMSGGSGSRLWPLSMPARPKQFHAIASERSLIQETALRLSGVAGDWTFRPPLVIGSALHADTIEAHLRDIGIGASELILEPVGRNTAAAAAIAAAAAMRQDPEALVLLAPSDHVVADPDLFRALVERTAPFARERIVTFGIEPIGPETGYGYIKAGPQLHDGVFEIRAFREKPVRDVAAAYLEEGGYSWNAGIFLFSPQVLLEEFAAAAEIRDAALAAYASARRDGVRTWLPESFGAVPSAPFDVAVMEKTVRGAVAPCRVGWADVGSWSEVWRLSQQDADGVARVGPVVVQDSAGSLIVSDGPIVAVAGLTDVVVIATADAVLVLPKDRAQDVRGLAEAAQRLKAEAER